MARVFKYNKLYIKGKDVYMLKPNEVVRLETKISKN